MCSYECRSKCFCLIKNQQSFCRVSNIDIFCTFSQYTFEQICIDLCSINLVNNKLNKIIDIKVDYSSFSLELFFISLFDIFLNLLDLISITETISIDIFKRFQFDFIWRISICTLRQEYLHIYEVSNRTNCLDRIKSFYLVFNIEFLTRLKIKHLFIQELFKISKLIFISDNVDTILDIGINLRNLHTKLEYICEFMFMKLFFRYIRISLITNNLIIKQ